MSLRVAGHPPKYVFSRFAAYLTLTRRQVSQGNSTGGHPGEAGTAEETRKTFSLSVFLIRIVPSQKADHGQTVVGDVKVRLD